MIYDRDNIQISELCPIQFKEPREVLFYQEQNKYVGKICNAPILFQILISEHIFLNETLSICMYNIDDEKIYSAIMNKYQLSNGIYYATCELNPIVLNNECACFKIESSTNSILADSLWYLMNPTFQSDIKRIQYTHSENDWNTIFVESSTVKNITAYSFKINRTDGRVLASVIQQGNKKIDYYEHPVKSKIY